MNRGDRVELLSAGDEDARFGLAAGDCGTVQFTDSLGTVHIRWDSGQRVGIIAADRGVLRCIPPAYLA